MYQLVLAIASLILSAPNLDREGTATPRVFASQSGFHFARSTPTDSNSRKEGVTKVYRVGVVGTDGEDTLQYEFDWYATSLYLDEVDGHLSIVRFGPWPEGREASASELAIALYWDGKELAAHSTLDIAGHPNNVWTSASHHAVISFVYGYRQRWSEEQERLSTVFEVRTSDGRRLAFDLETGRVSDPETFGTLWDEFLGRRSSP